MMETLTFIEMLYAPYAEYPAACLEIRTFAPSWVKMPIRAPREWFKLNEIADAAKCAQEWAERYEVYYGVLPRRMGGGGCEHLRVCSWLWADIDPGHESVQEASALALAAIRERGVPAPHIAVRSGGGVHLYWRLSEPILVNTDESRSELRRVLLRLVRCIGGEKDSGKAHACPVSTDAARILRLPGTFNHKIEGNPRPVSLLACDPDKPSYPLVWWKAHLPAEPLPPKPKYNAPARDFSGGIPLATARKLTTAAPEGQKHYTMLSVAVAARKSGADENAIRAFAEQVAAVSGVNVAEPSQQRHITGLVDWAMRTVQPEAQSAH